jgi:predicted RNase H-like HicB family nuclease
MKKYLIIIEAGPNNWSAFSPDVRGCVTTGKIVEETLVNIKEALTVHIQLLDEIPEPKGLEYHVAAGESNLGEIEENYFITTVDMAQIKPYNPNSTMEGTN